METTKKGGVERLFGRLGLAILLVIGAGACTPSEEGAIDSDDDRLTGDAEAVERRPMEIESIESYGYDRKEELEVRADRTLRDVERELEALRRRIAEGTAEARGRWQEIEPEVDAELRETENWLERVRAAGEDTWEDARAGLAAAVERLEEGLADARAELEEDGA